MATLGGLAASAIEKHGYPRIGDRAKSVYSKWKGSRRERRQTSEMMRSHGNYLESVKSQLWFRDKMAPEIERTLEQTDELLSHAYGIPYWKLNICARMGWTVSQFESLPREERLAWEEYFRKAAESLEDSVKRSQERKERDDHVAFLRYREKKNAEPDSQGGDPT